MKLGAGGILAIVLLLFTGVQSYRLSAVQREAAAAMAVRDSMLFESALSVVYADSIFQVSVAEVVDLQDKLQSGDEAQQRLGRQLSAANIEIRALVTASVEATGTVESVATAQDTVSAFTEWWEGLLVDSLLRGSWRFERVPVPTLALEWALSPEIEIIASEGGDGRWLVTGRALDPRVTLSFNQLFVDPSPPVIINQCGILCKMKWAAAGGVAATTLNFIFGG